MAKPWEKWRSLGSVYLNNQRVKEMLLGCPTCGSKEPTHIQIRGEAPPHCWKCTCGTVWAVKLVNGVSTSTQYSALIPWSQQ